MLPGNLVALFPGAPRRVALEATSVREVIAALDARIPGMADRLLDAGPALREHINVFVDGDMAALDTPVGPASVVHVIPAVSGGAPPGPGPVWDRRSRSRVSRRARHGPACDGDPALAGAGRHWCRKRGLVLVLTKGQYFAGRDL